jgi:hypothetical protein
MYRSRIRLFALMGIAFIPVSVAISFAQALILHLPLLPAGTDGEENGLAAAVALGVGLLFTLVTLAIVQSATARAMVEVDAGRPITALHAYRRSLGSVGRLIGGLLVAVAIVVLLDLTVVGIPIALWLLVRWSLIAQAVELEGRGALQAFHRSTQLVRGRWLRVASITLGVTSLALLLGPFLGALLLLVTDFSFALVNIVAGVVYAIVMPFVAIATTYLYFDLLVREQLAPREAAHSDVLPAELA